MPQDLCTKAALAFCARALRRLAIPRHPARVTTATALQESASLSSLCGLCQLAYSASRKLSAAAWAQCGPEAQWRQRRWQPARPGGLGSPQPGRKRIPSASLGGPRHPSCVCPAVLLWLLLLSCHRHVPADNALTGPHRPRRRPEHVHSPAETRIARWASSQGLARRPSSRPTGSWRSSKRQLHQRHTAPCPLPCPSLCSYAARRA